jgi:hypothetical protein
VRQVLAGYRPASPSPADPSGPDCDRGGQGQDQQRP